MEKIISLLIIPLLFQTLSLAGDARTLRRNPRQLADVYLRASASSALAASTYVSRLSSGSGTGSRKSVHGAAAVNRGFEECIYAMSDSAVRLRRSVHELRQLGRVGRPTYELRLSNMQTWVSAALTEQNMCLASLTSQSRTNMSSSVVAIRDKVVEVSRVTGIALKLVNRLG